MASFKLTCDELLTVLMGGLSVNNPSRLELTIYKPRTLCGSSSWQKCETWSWLMVIFRQTIKIDQFYHIIVSTVYWGQWSVNYQSINTIVAHNNWLVSFLSCVVYVIYLRPYLLIFNAECSMMRVTRCWRLVSIKSWNIV